MQPEVGSTAFNLSERHVYYYVKYLVLVPKIMCLNLLHEQPIL